VHKINKLSAWVIVAAAIGILNALFYTYVRLSGCTSGVGYGVPMGGGECQPFIEKHFGLIGFLGDLWLLLIAWPVANILLALFFCKRFELSKILAFAFILLLAPSTVAILRVFYPLAASD
jgi:hypothetical protein